MASGQMDFASSVDSFSCLCCRLLTFSNLNFSKNSVRNIVRVSNSLDQDQTKGLSVLI